jgi:hypothetical protein
LIWSPEWFFMATYLPQSQLHYKSHPLFSDFQITAPHTSSQAFLISLISREKKTWLYLQYRYGRVRLHPVLKCVLVNNTDRAFGRHISQN